MPDTTPRWLLALESSTPHGGAALLRDGTIVADIALSEGLRHGRELMPAAESLLTDHGLRARDLWAVAVSTGPGSYTGLRVGVMAAKALAYGAGCRLAGVSSLAALAAGLRPGENSGGERLVCVVQNARRDEVYFGLYRVTGDGTAIAATIDAAVTPEEAADHIRDLQAAGTPPTLAGSGFATYPDLFAPLGGGESLPGIVQPSAVGLLGWRQLLQEESADPLLLQPEYLRRDAGHDWSRDTLITQPERRS